MTDDECEPDGMGAALARMARDLLAQDSLQDTLDRIVSYAVELVEGCEGAGILTVRQQRVQTLAASDELVRASDRIQGEQGEGPCFDAVRNQQEVYRIADMTSTVDRWPGYAPRARELGIGSVMGFLLFTDKENLGALDLYSSKPNAFPERSENTGWMLASHAAVAFSSARHDAQLRDAIATRQDIGEALGIVMERYKVPEDRAFTMLRKASQDRNVKLRDLARAVVETGAISSKE